MTDYVLSGLVKRRAELAGEADAFRNRLAQISADLVHLDAVIRQFDPDHDIPGIRAKRPRGTNAAERGEMSRFVLGVLREAPSPVTVATIAQQLLVKCGVDVTDGKRARLMHKRVSMTLRHQERRGAVRAVRVLGRAAVWGGPGSGHCQGRGSCCCGRWRVDVSEDSVATTTWNARAHGWPYSLLDQPLYRIRYL